MFKRMKETKNICRLSALLSCLVALVAFVSCDADDPTTPYTAEYAVGRVTLPSSLTDQQRTIIGSLLDHMVQVEPCQFWMGGQSRSSARPNYFSSYVACDSMKITVEVDADGDTTIIKNSWYVDYVHIYDKRAYRHTLSNGKVRTDTVYFTQMHRMPVATGTDNGHLWVSPVTGIDVPNAYYIGQYEISQAEWMAVMGQWPTGRRCIEAGANQRQDSAWYAAVGRGDDYPAYNVWYADAVAFCERLNELCGMPNAEGLRFRLPTEVEWECAARGGRYSKGFNYPGSDTYSDVAWCSSNAFAQGLTGNNFGMHPHGELYPNELGLYDMAGNVSEWVENTYYRYTYRDSIATPDFNQKRLPKHAAEGYVGDTLILRGGSWYQSAGYAFCPASRQEYTHGSVNKETLQSAIMHAGFRVVLAK